MNEPEITVEPFVKSLEQIISVFLDKIISTQGIWKSKSDLVQLWNAGFINGVVTSRIIIKENSRKEEPIRKEEIFRKDESVKQEESVKYEEIVKKEIMKRENESKDEFKKCVFIITRGEKLGEQCTARAKHESYCVKHYKDPKQKKEETVKAIIKIDKDPEEKTEAIKEVSITNIKKKVNIIEYEYKDGYKVVKNTNVVVNDNDSVIGYVENKKVIHKYNEETKKVMKQYNLKEGTINIEEIDE